QHSFIEDGCCRPPPGLIGIILNRRREPDRDNERESKHQRDHDNERERKCQRDQDKERKRETKELKKELAQYRRQYHDLLSRFDDLT
ncbi:unnamed protein product, partial [Didymodactylos carnosus]